MIALASGLLALAGLFADRAVRDVRRERFPVVRGVTTDQRPRISLRWSRMWWLAAPILVLAVGPVIAVAVGVCTAGVLRVISRHRRSQDRWRREESLADAVGAVAAGLRAGLSLGQALAYARDEAQPPLREDLARLVDGIQVGVPVGEALDVWADGSDLEDVRLIAGVLDLHRRSGGDLPTVLDGLVETLRERRAMHREVRALTAQARLSGMILGTLPVGFFGFLLITSRDEMVDAMGTPIGRTAVATGLGLEVLAFLWIRRLLEVR